MFILRDHTGADRGQFATELAGRRALEDLFMTERKSNFYLYEVVKVDLNSNNGFLREIGRRINSNRFGGPRSGETPAL